MNYSLDSLCAAVERGSITKVLSFISSGSDVNQSCVYGGKVPIYQAIAGGFVRIVEALLQAGAFVNVEDSSRFTPLGRAISIGSLSICRLLVKYGAHLDAKSGPKGNIPLADAAELGNFDIVHFLLDKGSDIETKNDEGNTPLQLAITNNHQSVCKLLVGRGANVNSACITEYSPWHVNPEGIFTRSQPSLLSALHNNNRELFDFLLANGANTNCINQYGNTLLISAIERGLKKDAIELLLVNHANPNMKDGFGYSPLMMAVEKNRVDVANLLLSFGARIGHGDQEDFNLLFTAIESPSLVRFLLEKGVDPNAKNIDSWTVLESSFNRIGSEVGALLLDYYVDPLPVRGVVHSDEETDWMFMEACERRTMSLFMHSIWYIRLRSRSLIGRDVHYITPVHIYSTFFANCRWKDGFELSIE